MKRKSLLLLSILMLLSPIIFYSCFKNKKTTIESRKEIDENSEKEDKDTFQNLAIDLIVKYKKIQDERNKNPQNKILVAKVGDEEILDSDVNFVLESRHLGKKDKADEKERNEVIENMIQKAAAVSFTKKNNIYPKEDDVNNALLKLKENIENDEFEKRKADAVMKKTGWTLDEYVESYKKDIEETFAIDNLFKFYKQKFKDEKKESFKTFLNVIVLNEEIEKYEKN